MKYLIKFVAILPALSVGITSNILFILAYDYHWLVILCIANLMGFLILLNNYEETYKDLANLVKMLYNDLTKHTV